VSQAVPVNGRLRRIDLLAISLAALLPRLFLSWTIPLAGGLEDPNCAPDEAQHFVVVRALARGHVPSFSEIAVPYAAYPPTNYAVQALCLAALTHLPCPGRFPARDPAIGGYFFARLGSVILGMISALLLACAASGWDGTRRTGLAAGLVVAWWPQSAFLGSYVNGDIMTVTAGAGLALSLAHWVRAGEKETGLAAVGIASGLVLLGKPYGYCLLPPAALWIASRLWRCSLTIGPLLRSTSLAVLIAGPVLLWNGIRNGGDPLGTRTFTRFLTMVPWPNGRPVPNIHGFIEWFGKSSFGVFRNGNLQMPRPYYLLAAALVLAGLAMAWLRVDWARPGTRRAALWLGASLAINLALIVYMSWFVDFQPQGRYAMLSVLLVAIVSVTVPARTSSRFPGNVWAAGCLAFLFLSVIEAARLVYSHPCVPASLLMP